MKINQAGIDLIKSFEGLRLNAYQDSVGVWTIGYGHTKGVSAGDRITEGQAEQLLRDDLENSENAVSRLVKVSLTENQFAALVSFVFNLGEGSLKGSTLLKLLNQGDYAGAANQFGRWVFAGGMKLNGLIRRRQSEKQLFLKP